MKAVRGRFRPPQTGNWVRRSRSYHQLRRKSSASPFLVRSGFL